MSRRATASRISEDEDTMIDTLETHSAERAEAVELLRAHMGRLPSVNEVRAYWLGRGQDLGKASPSRLTDEQLAWLDDIESDPNHPAWRIFGRTAKD